MALQALYVDELVTSTATATPEEASLAAAARLHLLAWQRRLPVAQALTHTAMTQLHVHMIMETLHIEEAAGCRRQQRVAAAGDVSDKRTAGACTMSMPARGATGSMIGGTESISNTAAEHPWLCLSGDETTDRHQVRQLLLAYGLIKQDPVAADFLLGVGTAVLQQQQQQQQQQQWEDVPDSGDIENHQPDADEQAVDMADTYQSSSGRACLTFRQLLVACCQSRERRARVTALVQIAQGEQRLGVQLEQLHQQLRQGLLLEFSAARVGGCFQVTNLMQLQDQLQAAAGKLEALGCNYHLPGVEAQYDAVERLVGSLEQLLQVSGLKQPGSITDRAHWPFSQYQLLSRGGTGDMSTTHDSSAV